MSAWRFLTTTLVLGLALAAAHAAERDAIAGGAKLTKADAARTAPAVTTPSAPSYPPGSTVLSARGIEKKDIRRGMVIAKPGSATPHAKTAEPIECPPCQSLPLTPKSAPHD